ncbi:uncharacterized protein LOC115988860 [Quercus lobata]|uniref:uncharacterized protein LOC115988860 n=1 Tax=Quercus lobata TaxID=97700 RepID=UPI00124691FC|nr:uncharacterized protein LOC115988860 [Quercus lobata]
MVGSGPHQTEPAGSQRQDNFLNLERERDQGKHREGSVRTTHTSKNHFRVRSHVSQKQDDNKALQREIEDLKKKLRHEQRRRSASSSNTSDEGDDNYRQRSRTPPRKPVTSLRQLMDQIDKYKRVEEDQQLGKGKAKESKKAKKEASLVLGFSDEDKIGTIQPHDDALVVTLRIKGYDVKRVLVDQGSAVEVMYPDLYKGLNLKPEDLTVYNSPLVSFEGKTVTPRGQIRLPIQTSSDMVEVDFIVVDAYSPYTAIVARPWLHALEAVSSTLHQKVKYLSKGQVKEIVGNQTLAR